MIGALPLRAPGVLHDGAQRWPVQVIEVRVGDQHQIDRRQIAQLHARLAQPLQHEQPAREVGIDQHILPAHLHEKAGVADEGDAEFAVADISLVCGFDRCAE